MIAAHQIAFGKAAGAKPYKARLEYLKTVEFNTLGPKIKLPFLDWTHFEAEISISDAVDRKYIGALYGEKGATGLNGGCYGVFTFGGYYRGSDVFMGFADSTYVPSLDTKVYYKSPSPTNLQWTIGSENISVPFCARKYSPFYLFHANSNAAGYRYAPSTLWWAKIYDGEELKRSVIPVLDNANVPCMYDEVSGEFFYNQGDGEFIAGPVVDEVDYTAKDYIQDGLVAMWDGIENAGWGEHTDELKYVNLVTGKNYSFENSNNVLWGSDCLKILESGDRASGLRTGFYIKAIELGISTDAKNYTIECALRAYDAEYPLISFDGGFGRTRGTASIDNFQGVIYSAYLSDTNTHQWGVNGDIRSKTNSRIGREIFDGFYWDNREAYASSAFRFGYTYTHVCRSDIHCARVYNRVLTVKEHDYNRNIDKARFGL